MTSTISDLASALPSPSSPATPIQLSFPLPNARTTTVHLHLTINSTSLLLFLATKALESPGGSSMLGSFVYAIPSRTHPSSHPLSTPLYIREQSLETTTRIAKILAKRVGIPVYVGNSMDFRTAGAGGNVEEEMAGVRKVVEVVVEVVESVRRGESVKGLTGEEKKEKNGVAGESV